MKPFSWYHVIAAAKEKIYKSMTLLHNSVLLTVLMSLLVGAMIVYGSDPELITDFVSVDVTPMDGNFFTFTGFRRGLSSGLGEIDIKTAYVSDFPALQGLGISYALMYFQPGGLLDPHFHPRASKLIYVIQGTLTVGFVDSTDKHFNQTLQADDVFVVPRCMVHYMVNLDPHKEVKVIFSFSSANPGNVNLPSNLLRSGIPQLVLEKSFSVV
ncbi:hypothetical protein O6H91_08G002100 [Diphasiastrum complanatum]|uniref:Uncharacterized protein n=1 Tax=Diphasiastrum complanatum TaxID=34168 RepID=A0ACC2CUM4_DIPCM|nr:hypothetical protein O6H91_08G002100 [Diphasiastrum complanatum]